MNATTYPSVRVRGAPKERGFAYGAACRVRVRASLAAYRHTFEALGVEWRVARRFAQRARGRAADFAPEAFAELRGLAGGAAVDELDLVALNLRTEILALAQAGTPAECTAFALLPERTTDGHVLLAQNWDWLTHSPQTVVVLEVERDDAPSFGTVVEAGLLAKIGLNAAAVGIATNALRATTDPYEDGVPYHVLVRSLFDSASLADAVSLLERAPHASSANYLLASAEGRSLDLEAQAGPGAPRRLEPTRGALCHTNHFLTGTGEGTGDLGPGLYTSSRSRLRLALDVTAGDDPVGVELLQQAFADHDGYPLSVCAHPDASAPPAERGTTAASLVMDLTAVRAWIADGNPCSHPYRELDWAFLREAALAGAPTP